MRKIKDVDAQEELNALSGMEYHPTWASIFDELFTWLIVAMFGFLLLVVPQLISSYFD